MVDIQQLARIPRDVADLAGIMVNGDTGMNFDTVEPKPEPNHPFFGYDLITELVNTTKCPVPGCTNNKKKEQGICDECWSRVPESEKTVEGMFKGSMLGKMVSGMTEQIRQSKTPSRRKRLK